MGDAGEIWLLNTKVGNVDIQALADSGIMHSFSVSSPVAEKADSPEPFGEVEHFRAAVGADMHITELVIGLEFVTGDKGSWADFVVTQSPYLMVLGAEWLHRARRIWDSPSSSS